MKKKDWKIDPLSLFSHELKTPLNSLRLGLNLLEEDFEGNKNMLGLMRGEVEKMIDFITDNLDLRVIQEKKDLLQMEWGAFEPILSQTVAGLSLMARSKNLSFCEKKTEGLELFMDPSWLARALENLLSNALKFSPKAGKIFIEYGLNSENSFFLSVCDEGPGLSDSKKIFDLFYSRAPEGQSHFAGSGLGLCVAQAVARAHGGHIEAVSKQGKGALFRLVLPQARRRKRSA